MARLTVLPHEAIIDDLKGNIDFYVHRGIPCARAWPKSPGKHRSEPVMAQWPAFSTAAKEWKLLSQAVQDSYTQFSTDSGLSGRDLQVRGYLTGLYRYPLD
ncbi:hypothetical protein ES705_27271 [subsurface metagenome]